jgi:hypothetical protein
MFKNNNVLRDFIFAFTLIVLIRLVYQNHAQVTSSSNQPSDHETEQLFVQTENQLQSILEITKSTPHLRQLKNEFLKIKEKYHKKVNQEDALTYFLGPLYSISKVSKDHMVKKQLYNIQDQLTSLQQQADILQEKMFARSSAVLL